VSRLVHAASSGAIAALLAGAPAFAQAPDKAFSHAIAPKKIAEECVKLAAGQSIAYSFDASAAVDFNIHFHKGNDVAYPVKRDQVERGDDRFTAPTAEDYCLMWTNGTAQPVTVKGVVKG